MLTVGKDSWTLSEIVQAVGKFSSNTPQLRIYLRDFIQFENSPVFNLKNAKMRL